MSFCFCLLYQSFVRFLEMTNIEKKGKGKKKFEINSKINCLGLVPTINPNYSKTVFKLISKLFFFLF